jgi:glycosyltransferase involved in cell wall biosynthesis
MRQIDWVVMPSIWWENSPMVIQESFLHGRPLIASDIGGMREKITDGVNGLHFRVGSAEDLADRMIVALTEPGLWDRLSAGCPRPANFDRTAARHLELYRALGPMAASHSVPVAEAVRPRARRKVAS